MDFSKDLTVLILAAGKGKRMKSEIPKVLHQISGQPILHYVLSSALKLCPKNVFAVADNKKESVSGYIKENFPRVKVIVQEKQQGTAHAVLTVKKQKEDFGKYILILPGDSPLIRMGTLEELIENKIGSGSAACLVTSLVPDPRGYGRIIKNKGGSIVKIVEDADATAEEKKISEINSSIYCFDTAVLFNNIEKIKTDNIQKEYYLTDVIELLIRNGKKVSCLIATDYREVMGINDRIQLSAAEDVMRKRINRILTETGVTIRNPDSCCIESSVIIDRDVVIEPSCFIKGKTRIAKNSRIGPFSQITDTEIGENSSINASVIIGSVIGRNNNIGPYSYIRTGTVTGNNVKIEASSVTVNYDGFSKSKTIIGDDVFIGSDTMLIAPVKIGNGAVVAAGSVIYQDVPSNYLAIERGGQKNIKNGAVRYRDRKKLKNTKE